MPARLLHKKEKKWLPEIMKISSAPVLSPAQFFPKFSTSSPQTKSVHEKMMFVFLLRKIP